MKKVVSREDWGRHSFLQKITTQHDFDGWFSYFTIKEPSASDVLKAEATAIQYRLAGQDWVNTGYAKEISFIDFVSFGWDYSIIFTETSPELFEWRAVTEDGIHG